MAQELQDLKVQVEQLQAKHDRLQQEWDVAQADPRSRGLFVKSVVLECVVYLPCENQCYVFRGHHGIGVDEWIEEALIFGSVLQ